MLGEQAYSIGLNGTLSAPARLSRHRGGFRIEPTWQPPFRAGQLDQ
jgi:hypothetical protein